MVWYFMTFQIKSLDCHSYKNIDQLISVHLAIVVCNKIIVVKLGIRCLTYVRQRCRHLRVSALPHTSGLSATVEGSLSRSWVTIDNIRCIISIAVMLKYDYVNNAREFQLSCCNHQSIILEINSSRWMYFMQYYIKLLYTIKYGIVK